MKFIRFFDEIGLNDVSSVGGKNASLGEMYRNLSEAGVRVPPGFATTAEAYRLFIDENDLHSNISKQLSSIDNDKVATLEHASKKIREIIYAAPFPIVFTGELKEAYIKLGSHCQENDVALAVRSSATAEDLPEASFAGQQESFLNVRGFEALCEHVKRCFASLYTARAISYRQSRGYKEGSVALCVGVQQMVQSFASGVMFTIDTESGSDEVVVINAVWGLGETIVGGKVNPDEFVLFKPSLRRNMAAILKRSLGNKAIQMRYDELSRTVTVETDVSQRTQLCLSDEEAYTLAQQALLIEKHYSKAHGHTTPMDIEWAKAPDGVLYIIQARPETVESRRDERLIVERYRLEAHTLPLLLRGTAIGQQVGVGKVRVVRNLGEAGSFQSGEVLVTDITDPDWEPLMKKAAAVITNRGGRTCHAAIVAREIGVAAIVGTQDATDKLSDGLLVGVSCCEGEEGHVYEGELPYMLERIDLSDLKPTKTALYMNVGNPEQAFELARLPNDGVGLARMEFIITHAIGVHPMALVQIHNGGIPDEAVSQRLGAYSDPKRFFIEKLSEGVATIAAAFYPRPVIVRTSDFKSNEYKNMPGGAGHERDEENPMIGFRGASRYYSDHYREAFEWECEALKFIRDDMGLENVKIMLPFVRTPEEGRLVIDIMNGCGLVQGKNGLEIYAMCEIPSNVILADAFLKIFDGYSIGSNDLTQLVLGVDRDSALVSHVFDERNEAVRRMIKMAISEAKKADRYIGICGQAPSDYPEITEFLVEEGIDSISLNPDSLLNMHKVVEALEKRMMLKKRG